MDLSTSGVALLALVAVVVFLLIYIVAGSGKSKRNAILIVGRSGTGENKSVGKTALLKQLKNNEQPKYGLLPSLVVNSAEINVNGKPVRVMDVPGMVPSLLEDLLDSAKGIVFMIDSSEIRDNARRDAEILHDVLTHGSIMKEKIPLLIFCNKSDLIASSSPDAVKTYLERELQLIRSSAVNAVETAGGTKPKQKEFLGFEEEVFRFEHVPNKLTFASGSVIKGNIDPVQKFMAETAA